MKGGNMTCSLMRELCVQGVDALVNDMLIGKPTSGSPPTFRIVA